MSRAIRRLEGRVAIVTGAGQGIGAAASPYAREGAKVVLTGRILSKLDDVAALVRDGGGEALPLEALAGNRGHAEMVVGQAIPRWGRVDVLVNNTYTFADYLALDDVRMEHHVRTDMESGFIGSLQLMKACFSHMRDAGGGSIINNGSSYGIRCEPGFFGLCRQQGGDPHPDANGSSRMGQIRHSGQYHFALCAFTQGPLVSGR